MNQNIHVVALLDNEAAADIIDNGSSTGMVKITGLPPIPLALFGGDPVIMPGVAETAAIHHVSLAATPVAETLYGIRLGNTNNKRLERMGDKNLVAWTTPATLSGTAATDRHNIYKALAWRLNNHRHLKDMVDAYAVITSTGSAGTGTHTIGNTTTGGTSGATGVILATVSGATPALVIGQTSQTNFTTGETITSSSGATAVLGAPTLGVRLQINEAGNYSGNAPEVYPHEGIMEPLAVYAAHGFVPSDITNPTPAVRGFGVGTRMLAYKPVWEATGRNLAKGSLTYPANADPTAGNLYDAVMVRVKGTTNDVIGSDSSGMTGGTDIYYLLWINAAGGSRAAFVTALNAIV